MKRFIPLAMAVLLMGCSQTDGLNFDNVQTQTIQQDAQQNNCIIPKDIVTPPPEVQEVIDGIITDIETYIGPHLSAFDSYNDISPDNLVLIALLTSAGLDGRQEYRQPNQDFLWQIPSDKLSEWLTPIFGANEFLTLKNSSMYDPYSDTFVIKDALSYIGREFTLVCEEYQSEGPILRVKLSRYYDISGWRANGLFAGTRGYELIKTEQGYRLSRMVEYVKVSGPETESSHALTIDPM